MKKLVSYANCQGQGVIHFLKRSKLAEEYSFSHYNNYQIILKEQSAANLFLEAGKCDVFFYQPTPAIQYCDLSTEQMIERVVPKDALKLSTGYGFNHGFYPIVHHGQWQTSELAKKLAKENPEELLRRYDSGTLDFECARRFTECLEEQRRRECVNDMDFDMSGWISKHYRKVPMFISENHPASAYFAELARRMILTLTGRKEDVSYSGNNDVGLPCDLPIHSAVVRELGLEYQAEPGADKVFRKFLLRLIQQSPDLT